MGTNTKEISFQEGMKPKEQDMFPMAFIAVNTVPVGHVFRGGLYRLQTAGHAFRGS